MEFQPFCSQYIILLPALFPVDKIIFSLLMQQTLNKYDDHLDIFLINAANTK
jgi:hypothetical protein